MNLPCAKCNKTVYPVEKLSCLDKIWHKACFKCSTCEMTLNMKTYKGYNKLPYCNTHYPSTKFTTVADTPENKRLSMNTKNSSTIMYHKEAPTTSEPRVMNQKIASDMSVLKSTVPINEEASKQIRPPQDTVVMPPAEQPKVSAGPKVLYRSLYDYTAADSDEVSFQEGDIIEVGEIIDEGWMTGLIQRTQEFGMLPYNYVEKI